MGHDVIKKHVKNRLNKGHDIVDIKKDLVSKGIPESHVHNAIDNAYGEIKKSQKFHKETHKLFYPSKSKIIFPSLLLVFLLINIFTNFTIIPNISNNLCDSVNLINELDTLIKNKDSIEKVSEVESKLIKKELSIIDDFKKYTVSNLPLIFSEIYWLNPFYPTSCEARGMFKTYACRYYISPENYRCLKDDVQKTKLSTFFKGKTPDYNKVQNLEIIVHTLFILFVAYILNCMVVFAYKKHRHNYSLKTIELFEFSFALIAILLLSLAVYLYFNIVGGVL